jgi:hypothetical protein
LYKFGIASPVKEERKLRMRTVLRRTVGPKRGSNGRVIGSLIMCTLHRKIKSRRTIWAGHVTPTGQMGIAYKILVGK